MKWWCGYNSGCDMINGMDRQCIYVIETQWIYGVETQCIASLPDNNKYHAGKDPHWYLVQEGDATMLPIVPMPGQKIVKNVKDAATTSV